MAKGIPRPGGWTKRFFTEATPYELGIAGFAVVSGALSSAKYFDDNKPSAGWILAVVTAGVFLLTVGKILVVWFFKEGGTRRPHDLAGCLHALESLLTVRGTNDPDPHLRLTIHVPFNGGNQLQQVVEYVGDQRGGGTFGRVFPAQSGIIGRALREKKPLVASRKNTDYLNYIQELVNEWGYTPEDARRRDPATMAWMAVPLTNQQNGQVEGIVYLDSTDPGFFNDARIWLVSWACVGIARYVAQRYN